MAWDAVDVLAIVFVTGPIFLICAVYAIWRWADWDIEEDPKEQMKMLRRFGL